MSALIVAVATPSVSPPARGRVVQVVLMVMAKVVVGLPTLRSPMATWVAVHGSALLRATVVVDGLAKVLMPAFDGDPGTGVLLGQIRRNIDGDAVGDGDGGAGVVGVAKALVLDCKAGVVFGTHPIVAIKVAGAGTADLDEFVFVKLFEATVTVVGWHPGLVVRPALMTLSKSSLMKAVTVVAMLF